MYPLFVFAQILSFLILDHFLLISLIYIFMYRYLIHPITTDAIIICTILGFALTITSTNELW